MHRFMLEASLFARRFNHSVVRNQYFHSSRFASLLHFPLSAVTNTGFRQLLIPSLLAKMTPTWRRMTKKQRAHIRYLPFILLGFIAATILYNELYMNQEIPQRHRHQVQQESQYQDASNYASLNMSSQPKRASRVELDRFTTCSTTTKYRGRNVSWDEDHGDDLGFDGQGAGSDECDVFSGKWVFDNVSYPLYNESDCPYMSDQLACHKHGRHDLDYQHWRWQPHGCDLKRWNVTEMWEKLRGKRLMFVGDSLNRGQWISMVCLLSSVIPADKRSMSPNAHLTIFRAEDYNATVEFLWAPLLVDSNSDDPVNHRLSDRIIAPDSAFRHLSKWENADILIFNTYLWWRQGSIKLLWSGEEDRICEELDGVGAMALAMKTWAKWVHSSVDPLKKRVFFVTMSPTHQLSEEWNPGKEGNCYSESTPIESDTYRGSGSDLVTMQMVKKVLSSLGSKLTVLNITQLSEYRKDGHPSIYRKFWETLSPEQLSRPESFSDCIHWCLPGVPDVWNQLLFHFL